MELIKQIVKVGNSAGVVLPKEWLHGEARVTLLKKPDNPKKEILDILEHSLSSILGLYLVGSYARGEQNAKSDIDVLAITTDTNKHIVKGRYDIILVSRDKLESSLKDNILPLLPMILEASTIINSQLIAEYRHTPLTKHNLKWHVETTKSSLDLADASLSLDNGKNNISDNIAYALVLRLREAHIVDSIMKDKKATTATLCNLIKNVTGSLGMYDAYQRSKAEARAKKTVSIKEAKALHLHISGMIKEQEEWIRKNA